MYTKLSKPKFYDATRKLVRSELGKVEKQIKDLKEIEQDSLRNAKLFTGLSMYTGNVRGVPIVSYYYRKAQACKNNEGWLHQKLARMKATAPKFMDDLYEEYQKEYKKTKKT